MIQQQEERALTPEKALARFVAATFGRVFDAELAERLLERLTREGEEPEAAVTRLEAALEGSPERRALAELCAVGETYFFRGKAQFDLLESETLPRLAERKTEPVLIWSAGCSTGEEAYSLAIVARRLFGDDAARKVRIIATDLNPSFVDRARKGSFQRRSFRGVSAESLFPYLEEEAGGLRATDGLKALIEFREHNLVAIGPYAEFLGGQPDIVFCRNVSLYFNKETARTVNRRLAEVLKPGGTLFLGAAETVLHDSGALRIEKKGSLFVLSKATGHTGLLPPDMPVPPAVRQAEFRRATGMLGKPAPARPFHGGTGPLAPLPFRADVDAEPPPEEGRLGQAVILIDMGDYAGAAVLCHSALEEDPFRPAAHFMLGLARRLQGSYQEAVHQFRAASYLQPDDWLAPFHLAESYRALAQTAEAVREYKSCLARMDAGGPEPAPALLGGFAPEYVRRASTRQIEAVESAG